MTADVPTALWAALRAKFEREGFLRVPNLLQEMAAFRYYVSCGDWTEPQPDAIESPQVRARILSKPVLGIARALLGPDIVYYGQSTVRYEKEIGPITLKPHFIPHQDAPVDTDRPLGLARFGLYLSDFTKGPGALRVWPGSHLGKQWPVGYGPVHGRGAAFDILSRPGDLVIWNLRTQHSAGYQGMPMPIEPRCSVIWDFGAKGADVDGYISYRVGTTAKRAPEMTRLGWDSEDVRLACEKAGVELRTDILDAYRIYARIAA